MGEGEFHVVLGGSLRNSLGLILPCKINFKARHPEFVEASLIILLRRRQQEE
jgi:hypothetical protein